MTLSLWEHFICSRDTYLDPIVRDFEMYTSKIYQEPIFEPWWYIFGLSNKSVPSSISAICSSHRHSSGILEYPSFPCCFPSSFTCFLWRFSTFVVRYLAAASIASVVILSVVSAMFSSESKVNAEISNVFHQEVKKVCQPNYLKYTLLITAPTKVQILFGMHPVQPGCNPM